MKKGFTLVELLVVVAILGILAAVGILSYNGFLGETKEQALRSQHNMIVKFIQGKLGECWLGKENIITLKNGENKITNCNEYIQLFKKTGSVSSVNNLFYEHFYTGNGWLNTFAKNNNNGRNLNEDVLSISVMQIVNGYFPANFLGYTAITPLGDYSKNGDKRLWRWCGSDAFKNNEADGEVINPAILVVTNLSSNKDITYTENKYSTNDSRIATCVFIE